MRELWNHIADAHGTLDDDEFKELQMAAGLNYDVRGLLGDPMVGIASQVMFDWSHTYIIGGLLDNEMGLLMDELRRVRGATYVELGQFVEKWTFPSRQRPNVAKLFDAAAIRSHHKATQFKATASDILSLSPVFVFSSSTSFCQAVRPRIMFDVFSLVSMRWLFCRPSATDVWIQMS